MGLNISDIYRFFVDIPGTGIVQMYPQNPTLKWVDAKKPGYRFHQRTLSDKLVFVDIPKNGIHDFTTLYNLERQGLTCEKIRIYIDRLCKCDNVWTTNFYQGYLRLSEGKWNVSRCMTTIGVVVEDSYTCVTTKWKNEVNLFTLGDAPIEVSPFVGVIQRIDCESEHEKKWKPPIPAQSAIDYIFNFTNSNLNYQCLYDVVNPPNSPWTLTKITVEGHFHIKPGDLFNKPTLIAHFKTRTGWAREFVAGVTPPPGPFWVPVTGGYARPVNIVNGPYWDHTTPEGREALAEEWHKNVNDVGYGFLQIFDIVGLDQFGNGTLPNGKELGPILEDWFMTNCGLTFVSDFLNVNPDNTAPANDYYTRAAEDAHHLVIYQVSDVARLDETQSATIMNAAMKDLIDGLKFMFNGDFAITSGTTVRFEHNSYFSRQVTLDLTLAAFLKWIKGAWAYDYDQLTLPFKENYRWATPTDNEGGDFDGYPITYDNACVNDREDQPENNFGTGKFISHIVHVYGNEDFFDSKDILIISTDGDGHINYAQVPITNRQRLNGNLALGYLLPRYHDFNRPFKKGYINKVLRPFYQTIRQRKQVPFTIPFQCQDYRDNYDATGLVKTQMGAGEIEKATYTDPIGTLTLELKQK